MAHAVGTPLPFTDHWPATPGMLWTLRHRLFRLSGYRLRFCPTCGHAYPPGYWRDHVTSRAHADQRGWWRR